MTLQNVLLITTATVAALNAGLFFAFSFAVNLGLARLSNAEYVRAMQSINRRIQNPVFFAAFFGAPVLLIVGAILNFGDDSRFRFLLAAAAVYLIGVFGVTIFGNVPLNNALDRFDLKSASAKETDLARESFERRWNNLNTVRTISSTIAVILIAVACLN